MKCNPIYISSTVGGGKTVTLLRIASSHLQRGDMAILLTSELSASIVFEKFKIVGPLDGLIVVERKEQLNAFNLEGFDAILVDDTIKEFNLDAVLEPVKHTSFVYIARNVARHGA